MTQTAAPEHLTAPLYSYAEADRLAAVTAGTSKRWLVGYAYRSQDGSRIQKPPVVGTRADTGAVSFMDLLEIVAVGRFRALRFSLVEVRRIVSVCSELFGLDRPLSSLEFKVGGGQAFVANDGRLHEVLKHKAQVAWEEALRPFLMDLEYENDLAVRWWPLGPERPVMIDPRYGYGAPVIANSGVRVDILVERIEVGEPFDQIANDFRLRRADIEAASQFAIRRSAA